MHPFNQPSSIVAQNSFHRVIHAGLGERDIALLQSRKTLSELAHLKTVEWAPDIDHNLSNIGYPLKPGQPVGQGF
jgi:hypothetical protein